MALPWGRLVLFGAVWSCLVLPRTAVRGNIIKLVWLHLAHDTRGLLLMGPRDRLAKRSVSGALKIYKVEKTLLTDRILKEIYRIVQFKTYEIGYPFWENLLYIFVVFQ